VAAQTLAERIAESGDASWVDILIDYIVPGTTGHSSTITFDVVNEAIQVCTQRGGL
jgi:hypothetical protein